jgi:holo-[acyl-carrier protein] synthase
MITGLGSDIVQIERVEKSIKKFRNKFLHKIFTISEIEIAKVFTSDKRIYSYYAKRFAAKEAFVKALGVGFRNGIKFTDIEVINDHNRKPSIALHGAAKNYMEQNHSKAKIHLSLTDDYPVAMAVVIIEG